jgi:tetratricopeptide (TPR) repeat protein
MVVSQEPDGRPAFDRFRVRATPTILFFDTDGSELDWIVGYGPPPDGFQKQLEKVLAGTDTYKSLAAKVAADPKNVGLVYKLAQKWDDRYDQAKAAEMYKQVVALDPEGKAGTTEYESGRGQTKVIVSYTQMAEFNIASNAMSSRPPDIAPFLAFVKKYPDSPIVKDAYGRVSSFYGRQGAKEDATKFFEEYTKRFPGEAAAYGGWVTRILFDKEPVDKGIELAQKAVSLSQGRAAMGAWQSLGRLYVLKGDKAKAIDAADQMMRAAQAPAGVAEPMGRMGGGPGGGAPGAAQIYLDAGASEKALAAYGPAYVTENEKSAPMLSRYAQFWSQQGTNLDSASAAAKKVTELTPNGYSGYLILAQVYQKMKNYPEALKAAEKALAIAPAQPAQLKAMVQKAIDEIKAAAAEKK